MFIKGEWYPCDDGVIRPIIRGDIEAAAGVWKPLSLLVDTAADQTVLSADILRALSQPGSAPGQLAGVGGRAATVHVTTRLRVFRENGAEVFFRSQFAAFPDPAALDMSVLGRDILDLFAVIVDRPGDVVCLVGHGHSYSVHSP